MQVANVPCNRLRERGCKEERSCDLLDIDFILLKKKILSKVQEEEQSQQIIEDPLHVDSKRHNYSSSRLT